ncbi:MAG TPA: hypothetical protein VM240_09795 [Verrucomicrobiae bacterium]|nr:hypothetical protein [Verrucomicrobiae bacterium]
MRAGALLAIAATLGACNVPVRVNIDESGTGYVAIARSSGAERCALARERVDKEANYFCEVRKQGFTRGRESSEQVGESGCRIELTFWCTVPSL